MRYKSGEGELGCFSGPTVNCEHAVTGKAEFKCHTKWKIMHVFSLIGSKPPPEVVSVNPVRSGFNGQCGRGETASNRFHCRIADRSLLSHSSLPRT